jgi:pimeloyl-ACP methyl ester carboxylesterase
MTSERIVNRVTSRDDTEVGYWTSGTGPPLLLVHGGAGDHSRWDPLLPHLEPHVTVHAMDRRGRGASGDNPDWSLKREHEDVAAVVDAVAETSTSKVAVYGHSGGGYCAFHAAMITPNIDKLALYEGWPLPNPEIMTVSPDVIERMELLLDEGERETVVETLMRDIVKMSEDEIAAFKNQPSWKDRVSAAHTLPRELRAFGEERFDPEEAGRIAVPTLLMAGTEGPDWQVETVAAAIPDAQVEVLEGQGHAADIVAPEVTAERLLRFLEVTDGSSESDRSGA